LALTLLRFSGRGRLTSIQSPLVRDLTVVALLREP
jgi:hypothetical protein